MTLLPNLAIWSTVGHPSVCRHELRHKRFGNQQKSWNVKVVVLCIVDCWLELLSLYQIAMLLGVQCTVVTFWAVPPYVMTSMRSFMQDH